MKNIQVTVIYALPDIQYIKEINMKIGSTVKEAILESNILRTCKNISLYKNKVGIYNKLVHLKRTIKNGDRIEIYRSLYIDPKVRRREKYLNFIKKNNIL